MGSQQIYLCNSCKLNFTNTPACGKPLALKATAVLLYVRRIGSYLPFLSAKVRRAHHVLSADQD
jgi:hypothetical protein